MRKYNYRAAGLSILALAIVANVAFTIHQAPIAAKTAKEAVIASGKVKPVGD